MRIEDSQAEQIRALYDANERLRERVRQLEAMLIEDWNAPIILRLSKTEEDLLSLLMKRDRVTIDNIVTMFYHSRMFSDMPDNPLTVARVRIYHLRAKLRKFDIHITCKYLSGYTIAPDDKMRLRKDTLCLVKKPRKILSIENTSTLRHSAATPA